MADQGPRVEKEAVNRNQRSDPGKYRRPQTGYILIQTSTLKVGFDELMGLCEAYFSRYGKGLAS